MKLRPRWFRYTIKRMKLKLINKVYDLDFEGYYSAASLNLDSKDVTGYEPCYNFSNLLRKCKIKNNDTFIDIGSGKGCALYYAKKFPFSLIDGIEISKSLSDISSENIKKINDNRLHIYNMDARDFLKYDDYNYFYMYNPCKEEACTMILNLILNSYKANKRTITVIYQTPKFKDLFINNGFKVVYSNKRSVIMRLCEN